LLDLNVTALSKKEIQMAYGQAVNQEELPQYQALRQQFIQQQNAQKQEADDAISRRFAAQGALNSGPAIKQQAILQNKAAQRQDEGLGQIGVQEATELQRRKEVTEGRTFQSGEAEKQRGFLSNEGQLGRTFQSGEGDKQRGFMSGESDKQRGFMSGESALGRRASAEEGRLGRETVVSEGALQRSSQGAIAQAERDQRADQFQKTYDQSVYEFNEQMKLAKTESERKDVLEKFLGNPMLFAGPMGAVAPLLEPGHGFIGDTVSGVRNFLHL
jgi:hypothetical protein